MLDVLLGSPLISFSRFSSTLQDRRAGAVLSRRDCHLTIHAVATCWGYPQPDRFSRAFRTAVGMSPSEYRVAMRTAPAPGEAAGEAAGAG
ncbi:helix-turn-helix domain-containing protein [Streptomyces sp. NPDC001980]|uniref:helix-turn-helix domain-containing protein n=1 Tax=Streptomyces sp. NPDC001980 TaxID=3157126 RepID=UPI0033190C12